MSNFISTYIIKTNIKPIGELLATATDTHLLSLEFADENVINKNIAYNSNDIIHATEQQIQQYFSGKLKKFDLPLFLNGTDFQKQVWQYLLTIPFGKTIAYGQIAQDIKNNKNYCRAVAQANASNKLVIIVPCHRVINSNGNMGGYSGNLSRKKYLLELESL